MNERTGEVESEKLLAAPKSPLLEVLATYGEPVEARRKHLRLWSDHRDDALADGTTRQDLTRMIVAASIAHVWHRLRHGEPTAVPAGLLLAVTSIATLSFLLVPADPMPDRVHLHIAAGLVAVGIVFVRWPRWQPPGALAASSAILGSGMGHALTEFQVRRSSDYLLIGGCWAIVLGAGLLTVFWRWNQLFWRRRGLEQLAAGGFAISIGDLDWSAASTDPGYTASCLASSAFAALTANAILRLRAQQPSGSATGCHFIVSNSTRSGRL